MAPPNIAVYTVHENKEILTSESSGTVKETAETTVVKAWMRNDNKISGMLLKANLHNSTFPTFDLWRQYDTVPGTSHFTGFDTTFLMDNGWNSTRFTFNSATNKMLFFDTLTNAIGDYSTGNVISKGDVANFKGSFNIDSISVANSYGNVISSITDVFTHMRDNDYSSIYETGRFEEAAVQRESNLIDPITGDGDLQKPTSAVLNGENEASDNTPGLSLFTNNWGPSGFILKELYLVQDSTDNVLAQASLNGVTLEDLNYTTSNGKSVWNSTGYNQAGNAQIAMKATIDDASTPAVDGHLNSGTAAFYIQFSNSNNSSSEAQGTFIVKASTSVVPSHNTNFGENKLIGVSLILPNLGSTLSLSELSVGDGDAVKYGAKLRLQFNVTGQNALYKMEGNKIVSGTGHKVNIYVTKVYRERTDGGVNGKEYGVLYGEGNVTLIPDGTKVVTSDSQRLQLDDQYGLYHNATYKYYGTVTSALTGETIDVEQSISTKPGICRNLDDYPTTTDSGIYAIWENAKATGNYQSLNYRFEVKQIKFNVKAYNRDGTVEPEAPVDEVSVAYNYQDTGISTTSLNILGTFLPGLSDKVTARVQAYNNKGSSSWLSSSVLSVVESVNLAQAALTGVEIRVAQNPINIGKDDLGVDLPVLGGDITTLDGYATKSIVSDSFKKLATYETNFVELIVPEEQDTIASYLVFVQGRFYGEVPKGDLTDRKIIVAGKKSDSINENKYNLEIDATYSFAVIAKYNDGTYSRTPSFNFSVTMYPKAAYPPPTPVDNLSVSSSGVYNALNISCDIPANSFIDRLELYQVVFDEVAYGVEMQSEGDLSASTLSLTNAPILHDITEATSSDFTSKVRLLQTKTSGIPASGSTSFNLQRKFKNSTNSQITWGDNMYGAFVCLAYNVDGVRSTDKLPTEDDSGNLVYDTTATYIFGNTGSSGTAQEQIIAIGKTQPPEQATSVSVSDSKVTSNIQLTVGLPSPNYQYYSHDTPLKTKIDVKLTGYGSTTTTTGGTTEIMLERDQSSFSYNYNTTSSSIYSGKVCQNTKFEVTAEVSTNMQPTWAGTDNFVAATETKSITTKAATYKLVGADDYAITKEYTKNQKPCINVDPYVKSGESVEFLKYPALDSGNQLQGVSITAPPCLYPEWKRDSENPDNPTNFLISGGHNPGLVEGDILFVMNKWNGATLDSLVLTADHIALMNDASQSTNRNPLLVPVLKASKPATRMADTGNATYQFGVWTASTQSICRLEVESAYRTNAADEIEGNEITSSDTSNVAKFGSISGGPTVGQYVLVKLIQVDRTMKKYENGFYAEDGETSTSGSYSFTISGLTSENISVCNLYGNDESDPALAEQPYSEITSLTYTYARSNLVKVVYDAATVNKPETNKLYLNKSDASTQSINFTNGAWNYMSFHVVDTTKSQWNTLFDQAFFTANSSATSVLIVAQNGDLYNISSTSDLVKDIDYNQGYFVKIIGADVDLTVTGKQIRGLRMELSVGLNFMGYPMSTESIDATELLGVDYPPSEVSFATLFDWFKKLVDSSGNVLSIDALNPRLISSLGQGQFVFRRGKGVTVFTQSEAGYFEWGQMNAPGVIGDINSDGDVNNEDVQLLGQFLAQVNDGKQYIEALDPIARFEQCNFNGNTIIDIGDAVILFSHFKQVAGFESLENILNGPSGQPNQYDFVEKAKESSDV